MINVVQYLLLKIVMRCVRHTCMARCMELLYCCRDVFYLAMRQRTTVETREITAAEDANQPAKGLFGAVDETLKQEGPLDEDEQSSLIREFEGIQLKQARTWRVSGLEVSRCPSLLR